MRSDRERLLDVAEACAKIQQQAWQGRERFDEDEVVQLLVHGYFELDLDVLWSVAEIDVPNLETQILAILAGLE